MPGIAVSAPVTLVAAHHDAASHNRVMTFRLGWIAVAVLAGAALIVGACGSSAVPRPDTIPPDAPAIEEDDLKFKPSSITIAAGEELFFWNAESAPHNVVLEGEDLSGNMRKGDVFSMSFPEAGEYRITCDYHPQMRLTVTVE